MEISTKDELLLERWIRRHPDALTELQMEYGKPFYGFLVAASGGCEKEAEELFIQAFSAALRSSAVENRKVSFLNEMLRCAAAILRASKTPVSLPDSKVLLRLSADKDIQVRLLLSLKILGTLQTEERLLILLRDLAELNLPEIAYVLGEHEDLMKKKLHEARLHFRQKMNESLQSKDFYDLRNH